MRDILQRWPFRRPVALNPVRLRSYLYINEGLVNSYLEQLGGVPRRRLQKRSIEGAFSGPRATMSVDESTEALGIEQRIVQLQHRLEKNGSLTSKRPHYVASFSVNPPPIVHEHCIAQSFLLRCPVALQGLEGMRIKLWVSTPDSSDFTDGEWDWFGSYLFLTEVHFDDRPYHHFISGCSALRLIFNAVNNRPLLEIEEETLGRFDRRTMIEKLISLGAMPGERRSIETLYYIRYMTNEQWHGDAKGGRRVHDIVGYPLFIAAD